MNMPSDNPSEEMIILIKNHETKSINSLHDLEKSCGNTSMS